jgi:protease II
MPQGYGPLLIKYLIHFIFNLPKKLLFSAGVVELADTPDLGSGAARLGGSSPFSRRFSASRYGPRFARQGHSPWTLFLVHLFLLFVTSCSPNRLGNFPQSPSLYPNFGIENIYDLNSSQAQDFLSRELDYTTQVKDYLKNDIRSASRELEKYYDYTALPSAMPFGEYEYYLDKSGQSGFKALFRKKTTTGKPELVIDPEYLQTEFGSSVFESMRFSTDGNMLAFQLSNSSLSNIIICNVSKKTRCYLGPEKVYDYRWTKDKNILEYSTVDGMRANSFYTYNIAEKKSRLIYTSKDPNEFIKLSQSSEDTNKNSTPVRPPPNLKLSPEISYDPGNYTTREINALSADGTSIPVLLYYRKTPVDKYKGVFINVYGAYGKWPDTVFKPEYLYLIDQGYILAFPLVRGGAGKVAGWAQMGRGDLKYKSIEDTIASAKKVKDLFPSLDLVLFGRSAGALTASQAVLRLPDFFDMLILENPFLDVEAYYKYNPDKLAEAEFAEWGNPENFKININTNSKLPMILIMASSNDEVIPLWQPLSFLAKVRADRNNPAIFYLSESAGHGGENYIYQDVEKLGFMSAVMQEHQNIHK